MRISMHLHKEIFELVELGIKTVEMRLYDEKRQQLAVGDMIEFISRADSSKLYAEITALPKFANFAELYKHYDKRALGYQSEEKADPKDMERFYPLERQRRYGVVAIEFKLSNSSADCIKEDIYLG